MTGKPMGPAAQERVTAWVAATEACENKLPNSGMMCDECFRAFFGIDRD